MSDSSIIRIVANPDIAALIPQYIQRRYTDLVTTRAALAAGDMETVRIVGHSMKGSGGGYGFDGITEIGGLMEIAGGAQNASDAADAIEQLADYLDRLEVVYD